MKVRYLTILLCGSFWGVKAQKNSLVALDGAYSHYQVDSLLLEKSPHYDVAKALYGQIPGLVVYQGAGTSSSNISSLSVNGHEPLVIIDGFPRDISEITRNEIASITLLKDATATALYGVEGANGVVVIETKRGYETKLKVDVSYQFGLSTQFRAPSFADAHTYANYLNEALVGDGLAPKYNQRELDAFRTGAFPYAYPNVNWYDQVYQDYGYNSQLNYTFTGGNKKFKYFAAVEYMRDKAMFRDQETDDRYDVSPTDTRLGVRTNMDVALTPTTEMRLGVMGRLEEFNRTNSTSIHSALYKTPAAAFPIKHENGIYGGTTIYGTNNPVALMNDVGQHKTTQSKVLANLNLSQDLSSLTEGLTVDAGIGFDYIGAMVDVSTKKYRYMALNPTINEGGTLVTQPVVYGEDSRTLGNDSWFNGLMMRTELQGNINYDKQIKKHAIGANVAYKLQAYHVDGRNQSNKRQSVLASVAYNFDERYYLDAVVNYSGTAYLPENEKYHLFPAVALGWVVSNESFLKDRDVLSYLKVFGSVGVSGSDANLQHELYLQSYGSANASEYYFTANVAPYWSQAEGNLAVEGLMPEISKRATVGLNAQFFKNRLALSATGFLENRSEILMTTNHVSGIIGIGVGLQNIGEQQYHGADFSLSWNDRCHDFTYGLYANGTYLDSEWIKSNQPFKEYDYLRYEGNAVNQMYGLEVVGIFQNEKQIYDSPRQTFSSHVAPGDLIYKDQNGDNIIDENDVVRMFGSSTPKFNFGFGFQLGYKGIEMLADFQGMTGRTVNLLSSPLYKPMVDNGTISNTFLENEVPWSEERASHATMPRLTSLNNQNNYRNNSLWYRDGSFLKLRNLKVAYTLPENLIRFADIQVYAQGTNLFSLDNIDFADPEQLDANYPSSTVYWIGAKMNF